MGAEHHALPSLLDRASGCLAAFHRDLLPGTCVRDRHEAAAVAASIIPMRPRSVVYCAAVAGCSGASLARKLPTTAVL